MEQRHHFTRRGFGTATLAGMATIGLRPTRAQSPGTPDAWPVVAQQIFGTKPIQDGSKIVGLDAPERALDAADVPISIRLLPADRGAPAVRRITLVIDQNPSPLAARFILGSGSGVDRGVDMISTLVRVDDYTNIHAIAELDDSTLHGVKRFVKAAGGCSAPTVKEETSDIPEGTMRFRQFPAKPNMTMREAQLIVRHPNNSGMQVDQLTRLYVPAHYITSVKIFQGDAVLLTAATGISMSQNPEIRFRYRPDSARFFRAEAMDNKDGHFSGQWPVAATA